MLAISDMHFGREWTTHSIEDRCPCEKAACGLVSQPSDDCEQHSFAACKTIRQAHDAEECPA